MEPTPLGPFLQTLRRHRNPAAFGPRQAELTVAVFTLHTHTRARAQEDLESFQNPSPHTDTFVPLGLLIHVVQLFGAPRVHRFEGGRSFSISGRLDPHWTPPSTIPLGYVGF